MGDLEFNSIMVGRVDVVSINFFFHHCAWEALATNSKRVVESISI